MTLKTRLNILIAVTLAVAVAATITVLRMNQANMAGLASNDETVNQAVSNISGELYPSLQACNTAKLAVVQVQQWLQDISSTRGLDGLDDGFDEADKWAAIFHEQIAYLHEHQPEREAELDEMNRAFDEFYATGTLMAQAYVDRGPSGGNAMMDEFDLVAGNINDMAETMVAEIEGEFKDAIGAVTSNQDEISLRSQEILWASLGSIGLLSAVIVMLIMTLLSVIRPVSQLSSAAQAMSAGDFTQQISLRPRADEIGSMTRAFLEMKDSTAQMIRQVSAAAVAVSGSSQELLSGAEESSRSISEVEVSIRQVANGTNDTNQQLGDARQNMREAATAIEGVSRDIEGIVSFVSEAASQGESGRRQASEASRIISEAAGSVQGTMAIVNALGEKTKQIAGFITIITRIADQTNLLALNAAIEAARAGDAGRGFAVVAEEVRKLAEESNEAAGSITSLVTGIESEMQHVLEAISTSEQQVTEGAGAVDEASGRLSEIVNGVQVLSERVQSISAAAEEVYATTNEVVQVMESVSSLAVDNAAASEQVSHATQKQTESIRQISGNADNLAGLAGRLHELVNRFQV
ncbi:MAG: HAMP domain-containing protein [Planctomycetales bacterium]|nr:HAMP domain-containing protein [bacterium]UNM09712.1 MAG: HAMP domain-containing protein [Planctomycetales bacterium]